MRLMLARSGEAHTILWRRAAAVMPALGLLVLISCGGDKGSTGPTPTAPVTRLLQQGSWALDPPGEDHVHFASATVTDSAVGRWEATVDWTFATNTVWIWVSNGVCTTEQFALPACPDGAACPCQFTIRSEVAAPKPRVLTIPNAPGGTRSLFIANLGPREESGTYSITLTPSSLVSDQRGTGGGGGQGQISTFSTGVKSFRRSQ